MSYTAQFAYRQNTPYTGNLSGVTELYAKLNDRDVAPIMTFNCEEAFSENGVNSYELSPNGDSRRWLGSIPLDDVEVLINRMGRSIKEDRLPDGTVLPPMINANATRSLAFRKHRAANEVLLPLGLTMPTQLVNSPADVERFLAENPAPEIILKPDNGTNSQGVERLDRSAVAQYYLDNPAKYGRNIAQPAYDFTGPLPPHMRAYDAASQEAFDGWNRSGKPKELRIYGFHSPQETTVFPIARAIDKGDNWFFVDPQSVPAELMTGTAAAIALAAEVSGAAAMLGTVDYGYGSTGSESPSFQAIELNGKAPYLLGYDKHQAIADTLRDQFADSIAQTAEHKVRIA
ncbi:hypothetical protein BH09PAT3_BH09PAT3_0940 [soil metagenome]